ncbi:MAG: radical SAM protein [Gracilibacteraceae bacterium]|nr:radical SAM protein [Gracilibacteraceae bacterium]
MAGNGELLWPTEALCPFCLKSSPARVEAQGNEVWLVKDCPEHGRTESCLWPDKDSFLRMNSLRLPPAPPRFFRSAAKRGCPLDCGFCARHARRATLVEIEVTERCNLRCPVCFMSAEERRGEAPPDPTLEELGRTFEHIMQATTPQTAIQVTGGEPTIRPDLPAIIRLGRSVGFEFIEINTNGLALARDEAYAAALAEAGATGIYLQFDGVTDAVFQKTRGTALLADKLAVLDNCRRAGLQICLAMTIIEGVNESQIGDVLRFALDNRDIVAGVAYQPAFGSGRFQVGQSGAPAEFRRFDARRQKRLTQGDVIRLLAAQSGGLLEPGDFWSLGCSHPLCTSSTYLLSRGGKPTPLTRLITEADYLAAFDPQSPQGSVLADIARRRFPRHRAGLAIVVMNYMDCYNLDLQKTRECSMVVMSRDGRLVPFCLYHLTDAEGNRLRVEP